MAWPGWQDFKPGAKEGEASEEPRRQKYRAQPTEVDGHLFPSKREAHRYQALRLREQAGEIEDLRLQFPFPLEVEGVLITHWIADFTYRESGRLRVEDAKGMRTEAYRLKRKLFQALYRIQIQEV